MHDEASISAVIDDLRTAASDLLDPIHAEAVAATLSGRNSSPIAVLIDRLAYLESLLPKLLEEAHNNNLSLRDKLIPSPTPLHAIPSLEPQDYVLAGRDLVPRFYLSPEPILEVDARPLAWLLGIAEALRRQLDQAISRLDKHLLDAIKPAAMGDYARLAQQELVLFAQRADNARDRAQRLTRSILEAASWRIHPTEVQPSPFPEAESWHRLRTLATDILEPRSLAIAVASHLASGRYTIADLPFLFQRWSGLMILAAMRKSNWLPEGDPMPAILIGGRIRFRQASRRGPTIDLWCEPQLARHSDHPSGLSSQRREASPDFVFIAPGPCGPDAFVLDPTLAMSEEGRLRKKVYLDDLGFERMSKIAGVPLRIRQRPLRSWAISPMQRSRCVVEESDGCFGTIPLHPRGDRNSRIEALRAWLDDMIRHALAWG